MPRRLVSSTRSQILRMTAAELKSSIRASEGRVVLAQAHVSIPSMISNVMGVEILQAFGADMIFLNGYSLDPEQTNIGLVAEEFDEEAGDYRPKTYRARDLRRLINVPLGVYLECGAGDDASTSTTSKAQVKADRVASPENLQRVLDEGFDFIVLGGNPGTRTRIETIIENTRLAKQILGDRVLIMAGKWEDGVYEKVLGDPLARLDSKDVATQLLEAGADVITMPMPGGRPGITPDNIRELIEHIHRTDEDALALTFLDSSVEGSDVDTVRQITLMSRVAGADIHAIGDAGLGGIAVPEDLMQLSMTVKGRRLTWLRLAIGAR